MNNGNANLIQFIRFSHSQLDVEIRNETDTHMRQTALNFVANKSPDQELHAYFNFVIECAENGVYSSVFSRKVAFLIRLALSYNYWNFLSSFIFL